jgi:trimeric autotransporter adhesin
VVVCEGAPEVPPMFASCFYLPLFRSFSSLDGNKSRQSRRIRTFSLIVASCLLVMGLNANGQTAEVSALTCAAASVTGPATDACTVTLTAAAPGNGLTVTLTSNDGHVTVPSSVTVAPGATSATFTASVSGVVTAQTAALSANVNGDPQSFAIGLVPPAPASLSCASGSFIGAGTDLCTVTLTGATGSNSFLVHLWSSNSAVSVPATVTVAGGGQNSATFTATVSAVATAETATLEAAQNSVGQTFTIDLAPFADPPGSLTCASGSISGAGTDSCTVTLTSAAPSGGLEVLLSSNTNRVVVPGSVMVEAGAASASFTAQIGPVSQAETGTVTATVSGVSQTWNIALAALAPGSLTCASGSFTGAGTDLCTVTLNGATGTNSFLVHLSSNNSAVSVPATVTVPGGGQNSATFTATVTAVAAAETATLEAAQNSVGQTYTIALGPLVPGSLACSSNSLTGATTDACTVTLTSAAPSGGLTVNLSSSNSAVTVPASVTIAGGSTSGSFTATASAVTTAQTATLTATANGGSASAALQLNAATPGLTISSTSLTFGTVQLNTATTQSVTLTSSGNVPVTINTASITGSGFADSGMSFPLTLNPNQTATLTVTFDPTAAGAVTGALTITSNATTGGTATVSLSGTGQAPPTPSAVSCTSNSLTGATTDACTVTLTSAAPSGGLTVNLSSSNSAVTVPASITVASGSTSGSFTATASAVTTAQTATLTATANGGSASAALQLNASVSTLSVNSSSIAFGNVTVSDPATQSVVLTSTGTAPVTVNAATVTGTGFAASGVSFPLTLNPNQTATLEVTFDPTAAGAASGSIALSSNCSMGAMSVGLSGTGVAPSYSVDLTWDAPTDSTDPVASYDVYRTVSGTTSYTLVGSTPSATTAYTDSSVTDGTSYIYYVVSVDAEGNQSAPSNTYSVTIP